LETQKVAEEKESTDFITRTKAAITVLSFGAGAVLYEGQLQPYWLYFLNDELTRWGAAGDWSTEPQRIYEFKFEPSVR